MDSINSVIIDDLQEARQLLKQDLVDYCPQINVIGDAEGVVTGLKLIKQLKPALVFLDINMNDGSGFDLLEIIDHHAFNIIFTTASDLYAIKAFKFSAVDYLLKPIDIDELIAAVCKIEKKEGATRDNYKLLQNNIETREITKLALHTQEKIMICNMKDIVRCESNVNYTQFTFQDGSKKLITKTLKYYDQILSGSGFVRVHQSHLINLRFVKEYDKSDGGFLRMTDDSIVPISTRKKAEVINLISNL